jgi:hypothetical protein
MMAGSAARSAALSAAVGAPVPLRALTRLSSWCATKLFGATCSSPKITAVKAPRAFAESRATLCAAMSTAVSP